MDLYDLYYLLLLLKEALPSNTPFVGRTLFMCIMIY